MILAVFIIDVLLRGAVKSTAGHVFVSICGLCVKHVTFSDLQPDVC